MLPIPSFWYRDRTGEYMVLKVGHLFGQYVYEVLDLRLPKQTIEIVIVGRWVAGVSYAIV